MSYLQKDVWAFKDKFRDKKSDLEWKTTNYERGVLASIEVINGSFSSPSTISVCNAKVRALKLDA